jgi:hypothetical protein
LSQQPVQPQPEPQQQQYKAYSIRGRDTRSGYFEEVRIYSLFTERFEMNHEIIDYYSAHENEPIIFTRGPDNKVFTVNRDNSYPPNTTHVIIPRKLEYRTYRHVPMAEIEILSEECLKENIRFCNEIKSNGPVIREILSNAGEENCLHPAMVEDTQMTYAHAISKGQDDKNNDRDSFTTFYKLNDKDTCYWDCPVCNSGTLQVFKHSKSLLIGESATSHPWVVRKGKIDDLLRRALFIKNVTDSLISLDNLSKLSEIDDATDDEFEVAEDLPLHHDDDKDDDNQT